MKVLYVKKRQTGFVLVTKSAYILNVYYTSEEPTDSSV